MGCPDSRQRAVLHRSLTCEVHGLCCARACCTPMGQPEPEIMLNADGQPVAEVHELLEAMVSACVAHELMEDTVVEAS